MGKSLITGIDIGHYSIKAVVVKPVSEGFSLVSFKELPISAGVFSDNHTVNHQEIVKKLKELRKTLPWFSRRAAITIPDSAVISKVLQVERDLDERETEFAIYQAFSHQSPFPIEELSLDYVRTDVESKTPTVAYQVYATKKEVVESRLNAVKKAGFAPIVCDVHAHSLVSTWQLAARKTNRHDWLLVDIGYSQTLLCMDFINRAPFCKEIALGTTFMEHEPQSMNPLAETKSDQFVQLMIERIQRQIQMLLSLNELKSIGGIWLSGGGALTETLLEELERRLNLTCQILNPLSLFEQSSVKNASRHKEFNRFSSAAGIAIRANDWLEAEYAS
ncbi:type IV pilus assembly protein PilM [Vibrio amylolyticus]|uniref:type IV pilus assembly protein PilM n=1 Tax=Vibrio amylolyticus TaxID=2847292 RepID=UPI00354CC6A8